MKVGLWILEKIWKGHPGAGGRRHGFLRGGGKSYSRKGERPGLYVHRGEDREKPDGTEKEEPFFPKSGTEL